MATKTSKKQVRRAVRLINADSALRAGVALFISKSFTRGRGDEDCYELAVDLETGKVACDCPHFMCRLATLNPTAYSPAPHLCKHLRHAVRRCKELDLIRSPEHLVHEDGCMHCGGRADFEVCDRHGQVVMGLHICLNCVHRLRFEAEKARRQQLNRLNHYEHLN